MKGEEITNWSGKKQTVQEDFIWGVGPKALYQITRAEYKTEPDSIKILDLIRQFTEFYMPKRNTYHNRGDFFWAKQTEEETPEEFWRLMLCVMTIVYKQHGPGKGIFHSKITDENHPKMHEGAMGMGMGYTVS